MKKTIVITGMLFLMMNLGLTAQEKFDLVYKMKAGKEYRYNSDVNMQSTQEMMGQESKLALDGTLQTKYSVESVSSAGEITSLYIIYNMKLHTKGMGKDTTISMPAASLDTMRFILTPKGKMVKSETVKKDGEMKNGDVMENFGNKTMLSLPEKPVSAGDTWNYSSTDTNKVGGASLVTVTNITYTMVGTEEMMGHRCVKVTYKGTTETTGKMIQMGMEMFVEGTGEPTGTGWFDPEQGILIKSENRALTEMTLALTGQTPMTIPMSQDVTTTQVLVE